MLPAPSGTLSALTSLARDTGIPEPELIARALATGVRQLWRERLLGQYLQGTMDRASAIEAVGIDWVELAERQQRAMQEDVTWGLHP